MMNRVQKIRDPVHRRCAFVCKVWFFNRKWSFLTLKMMSFAATRCKRSDHSGDKHRCNRQLRGAISVAESLISYWRIVDFLLKNLHLNVKSGDAPRPSSGLQCQCVRHLQRLAICIKNDEFCIKHDEFCINNDKFCTKNDDFSHLRGCFGWPPPFH